eukprot:4463330-Alexandrium_andersonii.AAC.1
MPSHERPAAVRPEGDPALSSVPARVTAASVPVRVAGRPTAPGVRGHRLGGLSGHLPGYVRRLCLEGCSLDQAL